MYNLKFQIFIKLFALIFLLFIKNISKDINIYLFIIDFSNTNSGIRNPDTGCRFQVAE